jgi:hypothetical protein
VVDGGAQLRYFIDSTVGFSEQMSPIYGIYGVIADHTGD